MLNLNIQSVMPGEEIPCDTKCPATGFQLANVCVPVTVVPFAEAGKPKTSCCGEAVVTPGKDMCSGHPNGTCSFTISQRILVEVPVVFGAKAVVGNASVECERVSNKDMCKKHDDYDNDYK